MLNYSILVLTYKIRHALQAKDAFNLNCLVCGSLGRVARVIGTDVSNSFGNAKNTTLPFDAP